MDTIIDNNEIERLAAQLFEQENPGRKWDLAFTERGPLGSSTPLPPATENERVEYMERARAPI